MVENDFSYKVRDNDKSIISVMLKEDFFGYSHVSPTNFSFKLNDLREEILADEDIMDDLEYSKNGIDSKYVINSKKIWKELGINLQKVQYLKSEYVMDEKGLHGKTVGDFIDYLGYDYPTELPIDYTDDFLKVSTHAEYLEFEKHNSVVFRGITLPNIEKKVNSCIYAHEITHIEQENAGGGINKITNLETLPIFIELLFGNTIDKNIFNKLLNHRLLYLAGALGELLNYKDMDFERRIKIETYIISILQATNLFNKYNEGNDIIKKEFIDNINKIFLGEKIIEQLLDNYDSNHKDIEPKLKVLKRK